MKTQSKKWLQWFAGFMDGDGSILVYKDHVSIEATTSFDDTGILSTIKDTFGGSIKVRSNAQALRWRSRKKHVVINVINALNGNALSNLRCTQLKQACIFYDIPFQESSLTSVRQDKDNKKINETLGLSNWKKKNMENAYLSGLFDAVGTISLSINWKKIPKEYVNITSTLGKIERLQASKGYHQCQIKCTSKYKENVEIFKQELNIGNILYEKNKENQTKWHWVLRQEEIPIFLEYLKKNPLKSRKKKRRFYLLKEYLRLKSLKCHLASSDSPEFKVWKTFCHKWYNIT